MNWEQFGSENQCTIDEIYTTLEKFPYGFLPMNPFKIFLRLSPPKIKIIVVGQAPFNTFCKITGKTYIDIIAFKKNKETATTPTPLTNIMKEFQREFKISHLIENKCNDIIDDWIKQSMFLINASLTYVFSQCARVPQRTPCILGVFSCKALQIPRRQKV
jgi:uracil DNA glycosylase